MHQHNKNTKLLISIICFFILATTWFLYRNDILMLPANLLFMDDEITAKSDAIICLSGAEVERVIHCNELFKNGKAEVIVVTGGELDDSTLFYQTSGSLASLSQGWLIRHGTPQNKIVLLPQGNSTYGEAVAVSNLVREREYKDIIVVSSAYHMRRVALVFKKTFRGRNINLKFSSASSLSDGLGHWWMNEGKMVSLFEEYIKISLYFIKGYI